MSLRVFCITSDRYRWAVHPFFYLFNIYWSELQPVVVAGYQHPVGKLPDNFEFYSISHADYGPNKWSDGVIQFLHAVPDDHFVLMLEDYWLIRTVNHDCISACHEYMLGRPDVLRFDLTDDRQYAGGMVDVESYGSYDIIETPAGTPYQLSLQAAIWNRQLLLQLLQRGKSSWETEIHSNPPPEMRVLGTRQRPVRYANGIYKGKADFNQIRKIPSPHRERVEAFIPKEFLDG